MFIYLNRLALFTLSFTLLLCLILTTNAFATESEAPLPSNYMQLNVSPEQCVALRQGQTCYQLVEFTWQSPTIGDFCLVDTAVEKTIQCWSDARTGQFRLDFQSPTSRTFVMRGQGETQDLAHQLVTVAWVYQSSKRPKTSWRLF